MKNIIISLLLLFPVFAYNQTHDGLYYKYRSAVEKGNFKKAEKELEKIALTENDNFIKLLTFGHFYSEKGELDSAKRCLEGAINYFKYSPISFSDGNFGSRRDSLYNVAIGIYDFIIKEEPNGVNYCNRAIYKKDVGRYYDALLDFNKAIELDPRDYLNHYNLALNYSKLNLPDSALMHYDLAIKYNPDYGSSYLNKGFIYLKIDSASLAIAEFEKALTVLKGTKEISYAKNNLGYSYYMLGEFKKAQRWIEESLNMNPLNSYAQKNLALIQIANEDYKAACKSINKAIELGFVDEYGKEILEMKKQYCED